MRKPGRVLYSRKAVRAVTFPLSFSAERRACIRHRVRKAATSAVDDMIYVHEKADATTRLHVEREIGRIAREIGITVGSPEPKQDSAGAGLGPAETGQGAAMPGQEGQQFVKSKLERDLEDSLWG